MKLSKTTFLFCLALAVTAASPAPAALQATEKKWDGSQPPQGIYFHWYEPSFYTGFAPRTQNPRRVHLRLARGNQVRFTIVLGDEEIDHYLDGLAARRKIYQELIDAKVVELTTNKEYERFTARLDEAGVAQAIAGRAALSPEAYREKSVQIMSALNPGRVFRIRLPLEPILTAWHARLAALDSAAPADRLDAANAILPGRINLYELSTEVAAARDAAQTAANAGPADAAFRQRAVTFLERATNGNYRERDGFVTAVEFTAIYPAGTVEGTTTYQGEKLPAFGVTGIWPLTARTQGRGLLGMVDYLSPNPGYGYISMLPYQHAGGINYNAFHNAGVRAQLNSTPFLPAEWRKVVSERDPKKPYQNLWIVGRGPTSHGCTRLPSGHMSELRESLPSDSAVLENVVSFRNLPQCYDVFDIDGDGSPEAMGVQYYQAYRSNGHTPAATLVANRREPFYHWLYGDNVELGAVGATRLKEVPVCRFVGRKAEEAGVLSEVPLYEAAWEEEKMQFYRLKPASFESNAGFEFNRELRKIGAGHALDRAKLFLK